MKELAVNFEAAKEDTTKMFTVAGTLQVLVEIFKIGHRDDFLSRINLVFGPIIETEITNKFMARSSNIRKNKVKLAQRIGCIFLKPRVAAWRYQRGSRTLSHLMAENVQAQKVEEDDEEMLNEDEIDIE